MNSHGWTIAVLRARAKVILIASLQMSALVVFAGDSIEESIQLLHKRDQRARAVEALVKAGPDALPKLLAAADVRNGLAINAILTQMGHPAIVKLVDLMRSGDQRITAADALNRVITRAEFKQAPALIDCLTDAQIKHSCGQALVKVIGPESRGRVLALLKALKDKDPDVRMYACLALGQVGPKAASAVPELSLALKDEAAAVRRSAAGALGKMGPAAKPAVPALKAAAEDSDGDMRRMAAEALKKIST